MHLAHFKKLLAILFCVAIGLLIMLSPHTAAAASPQSLDQAIDQVRSQTHGRILSAREKQKNRHTVYIIKVLLPDGQVKTFRIRTGSGSEN